METEKKFVYCDEDGNNELIVTIKEVKCRNHFNCSLMQHKVSQSKGIAALLSRKAKRGGGGREGNRG